jgi:hypothetical protein
MLFCYQIKYYVAQCIVVWMSPLDYYYTTITLHQSC